MRTRILLVAAATAVAVVWSTTVASGAGPSPGVSQGGAGLTVGKLHYVTLAAGSSTVVEVTRAGRVLRQMRIKGGWGLPLVAYDNTVEGLLGDGRTLVLAPANMFTADGQLRTPTTFKLVDSRRMKVLRDIKLDGAFVFDAASPDGRYLYLIEYFASEDPTLYRVRAYDLQADKLLAKIVADRRSWETGMQGLPISRTWKAGWAYTLYGANAPRPFIHALNTRGVEAVCIDLPWQTSPKRIFDFRLRLDKDGHLVVRGPRGRALAVIDRESFKVLSYVKNP